MHYILGEVLVKTLANSKTFQRFAVKTDAFISKNKSKITEHSDRIAEQAKLKADELLSEAAKKSSATAASAAEPQSGLAKFWRDLSQEIKGDLAKLKDAAQAAQNAPTKKK
jgi:gas vesicle protein